jgi:CRP-like cAMP-binding protein
MQLVVNFMTQPATISNRFLASLQPGDWALIEPHLQRLELRQGALVQRFGQAIDHVVFPLSGLISITVPLKNGGAVECAVVGREGIVGTAGGMGIRNAINDAIVQIAGSALQVSSAQFHRALGQSAAMRQSAACCDAMLMAQSHQSVACNAVHTAEARMARWLLAIRDRSDVDKFPLTQEFLARMLGVRRTTVTLIAGKLQSCGAIRWRRGRVQILDRSTLEGSACECYARVKQCTDELVNGASPQPHAHADSPAIDLPRLPEFDHRHILVPVAR